MPGTGRLSNKETAKALARLQAKIETPPTEASGLDTSLKDEWRRLSPCFRQVSEKDRCLLRPTSTNLRRQHHQATLPPSPEVLGKLSAELYVVPCRHRATVAVTVR